jgi:alpha-galactosidase
MWALNKSPLGIGAPANASLTPAASLQILSNSEVIAIDQDSLGQPAQLVRRFTESEYDIWAGNLSNSRLVVGIANWRNNSQSVTVDFGAVLGVASASVRNVWAASNLGTLSGNQTFALAGHELRLLVLSNVVKAASSAQPQPAAYYTAATSASLSGQAAKVTCSSGTCLPAGAKVGDLYPGSSATFNGVTAARAGTKVLGIDFTNYDIALSTAWDWGDNTRNMTIAVNGGTAHRTAFPIAGGDWSDTGRLTIEVSGFVAGSNTVVFAGVGNNPAPDLVGFELYE